MAIMSNIHIETQSLPQALLVKVTGDAGVAAVSELDDKLMRLTAGKPPSVIVDLSGLAFISSIGMGALVNFHKSIHRQGGAVRFAAPQPMVNEAFKRARLHSLLDIRPTVDA